MSYTTLYYVTPSGRVREAAEFRNSWRGAANVWANLYRRYLPERAKQIKETMGFEPQSPVTDEDSEAVWKLWKRTDIPVFVRAVLYSTFDYAFLEKSDFQRFYDDVLKYAGLFDAGSLIEQAQEILSLRHKHILGVCWRQTSVIDNLWGENVFRADAMWPIYKALDGLDKPLPLEATPCP